ncbi:MAG: hypothetical protein LPK21_09235, partial [Hymenobacteraceae bacterium]|nr:hypothetical protein [Hymenobacteraceae bacterium]MDX5512431.1 hypothetical protein [Hymenobacteraceae bacterium]
DPKNYFIPYEMGYAFYLKKDYKESLGYFKKVINFKDINDQCYQMLGNLYDFNGDSKKAIETYDKGLKLFPNSGCLYLEKGNMFFVRKEYNKALNYYEKGIEVEPDYPSNYYRATQIYLSSDEEVWGMLYGELFMNLERNSQRTAEVSKWLHDTYKSEIKFISDTSMSVSFSKQAYILTAKDGEKAKDFKLPFPMIVYEPLLMLSTAIEKEINAQSLNRIRTNFIEAYYKDELPKKYPNALFDYQKKIADAGHLEAYNHWILMKGDEEAFEKWYTENEEKWNAFADWFGPNPIELSATNKFYRTQY